MRKLDRLFRPKSIAIFGGGWSTSVVQQCQKMGFKGDIWPVHPKLTEMAGLPCYASVADLPGAPDASFIGVNRNATIDIVRDLSARGAGGAVCFASGFREVADGAELQDQLIEAAGDMPLADLVLARLASEGGDVWLASLRDRFADHGMTALLVVRPLDEGRALLDTLAISCRVLGRGFEYWLLAQLANHLRAQGVTELVISLVATTRNQPARDFLASLPTRPITTPAGLLPLADELFLTLDLCSLSLPFLEFYANE